VLRGHKPLEPVAIDPEMLLSRVQLAESQQRRLMESFQGQDVLDIEYEEIRCSLNAVVTRLRTFLELPDNDFRLKFDKATPDELREAIPNFLEIQDRFSNTAYQMYLG